MIKKNDNSNILSLSFQNSLPSLDECQMLLREYVVLTTQLFYP